MKIKNKMLAILFIAFIMINSLLPIVNAVSCNMGEDINLRGYGSVECHVRNSESGDYPVSTDLVGYYDNGVFYPAYCLNRGSDGADNDYTHTVNVSQLLENEEMYNKIWRVIVAGYPFHTAEELGVDDWTYAYQATKTAIYHIIGEYTDKSIEKTNVYNYYGTDEIGERTVNLMRRLVSEGDYGTNTYKTPVSAIHKSGDIKLDGDYYVQNYTVTANVEISSFDVVIAGFPNGTKITNTAGTEKEQFSRGEIFQIRIPKDTVETGDINGRIIVSVATKSYPIFYGRTYNSSLQNYAITADPIRLSNSTETLNLKGNTASLKIKKVDKDTGSPISDTTYELTDSKGNIIGRGTTDENGILIFNELYQDNYVIKEIKSNDNYVISQETVNIRTTYNKVTEVTLTNEHKKGKIQVHKVDKDNHKIALGNVAFDLYSEEFGKVIATYRTDANGEISIENLRTGNYKLIERSTNKWYNLSENTNIVVEWNQTADTTIENELKKGQVKVVKVDADDNEIKLEGVKFEVLDEHNNILETIITDKNGEAYTSKYPIRDYENLTLKEIETLEEYSLNDTSQIVQLTENEITTIQVENEVKKGQIKVVKVDKDNNEIKLEGVKFEVYNEDDELVQTLITDENGEAITDKLRINKSYYVKEVKTKENYELNEDIITVTLEDKEIKELTFENEKQKGQIQVIKIDSENNEIHIPDVTFEIYNSKNEVVDTITTDENGKAISKRLPIDDEYTIKETITNKEYVLTEETQTVTLETNEIKDLTFENTKKYGKLKITKLSNKYSKILDLPANSPIPNTKFLILNANGENMGIYTTDAEGVILTEKLPYGEYTVYEYETPEHFLKDAEPQIISITEDNQIIELTFKNTPVEPKLPKTGF